MDDGKEDFEAGVYGNSLELVMQSLSGAKPLTETQIQTETGLTTESLNFALSKLEELGRIRWKWLGRYQVFSVITEPPPQEWYTIDESAGYLRVSRRTMYKLIHDGQLAAYRVGTGGHRRLKRDDLDRLMSPEETEPVDTTTAASDPVLADLWDNEKDAAYDKL